MSEAFKRLLRPLAPGHLADLRRWAREWVEYRHPRVNAGDVLLAITELVSNALKHGAEPVDVELFATDELLRLQVSDRSDALPGQPTPDLTSEGGRGMRLIASLTTRWGVRLNKEAGKTVWCEFAAQEA